MPAAGGDTPQSHWWEVAGALLTFGTGFITFLRGWQASKRAPTLPPDDTQARLARQEREIALLQQAVIENGEWRHRHEQECSILRSRAGAESR